MRKEKNIDLSEDCPEQIFLDKFFQDKKDWTRNIIGHWQNCKLEAMIGENLFNEYRFYLHSKLDGIILSFPMPEKYETFETILNCFDFWEAKNG